MLNSHCAQVTRCYRYDNYVNPARPPPLPLKPNTNWFVNSNNNNAVTMDNVRTVRSSHPECCMPGDTYLSPENAARRRRLMTNRRGSLCSTGSSSKSLNSRNSVEERDQKPFVPNSPVGMPNPKAEPKSWTCRVCTFTENNPQYLSCNVCGVPRGTENVEPLKDDLSSVEEFNDHLLEKLTADSADTLLKKQLEVLNAYCP